MIKKYFTMGLISLMIALGFTAFASSAVFAHTGDLKVVVKNCDPTTGLYNLNVTLTTANVPQGQTGHSKWRVGNSNFQGTPTNANGMDRGPVTSTGNITVALGSFTLPGNTTGLGPWVYAFTNWTPDNFSKGSDGQLTVPLKGDCKPAEAKDASADVTTTPGTCDAAGSASVTNLVNAVLVGSLDQTPGSHTATFNANPQHLFANGSKSKDVPYTIEPKDVSQHCFIQPPDEKQTRQLTSKPTCVKSVIITTNQERTRSYIWDGTAYVPGEWSAWVTTSESSQAVDLQRCVRHAHVRVHVTDKCNCWRDKVVMHHGSHVRVVKAHPTRLTWVFKVTGKKVNGHQYLLPKRINGSHGWAKTQIYKVHTTNVDCPCHLTHTCPPADSQPPHHHCKTACKLND